MLEVRDVYKKFGSIAAVRGVSFDAPKGRVTALLGPNGAGKTTTIRMITGFTPPDAGRVRVGGFDTIDQSPAARALIGYMPENTPLYGEMDVRGFLRYRARLFGMSGSAARAAVERAIERCWLTSAARRRIGALSKGYRQRVGLAASLLHEPGLLILDEPTNGLDPEQVRQTRSLIRELAATRAVLITSHVLAEVELVCDRVVVIAGGEVKADGEPRTLLASRGRGDVHVVELRSPAASEGGVEAAVRVLASAAGVGAVRHVSSDAGGWATFEVSPSGGAEADVREAIAAAAAARGILIRELRRQRPGLESLFLDLIGRSA